MRAKGAVAKRRGFISTSYRDENHGLTAGSTQQQGPRLSAKPAPLDHNQRDKHYSLQTYCEHERVAIGIFIDTFLLAVKKYAKYADTKYFIDK